MPGFLHRVQVQLSDGTSLPPSFLRAHVQVEIVGRRFDYVREAPLDPSFTWTWDGLDAYGRAVPIGIHRAKFRVGFEYAGTTTNATANFGERGDTVISGDRNARTVTMWNETTFTFIHGQAKSVGLGGWTLDVNHMLDRDRSLILHKGDGSRRTLGDMATHIGSTVETFAGGGSGQSEGVLATSISLNQPHDVVEGPDGSVYISQTSGRLRRVDPNGNITTLAGLPNTVPMPVLGSPPVPALHAGVGPRSLAVGPDGSIYFSHNLGGNPQTVWKIVPGPVPMLHRVAGSGGGCAPSGDCGNGGSATSATFNNIQDIAVDQDGALFIADSGSGVKHMIRRVGPEGNISAYFDGRNQQVNVPSALALLPDGVLIFRDLSWNIARLEPTGGPFRLVASNIAINWCSGDTVAIDKGFVALGADSFLANCDATIVYRATADTRFRIAGTLPRGMQATTDLLSSSVQYVMGSL